MNAYTGIALGDDKNLFANGLVTRWYRPPELLFGSKELSSAIDIWSLGCIVTELVNRKPFLPGQNDMHQIQLIAGLLGRPKFEVLLKYGVNGHGHQDYLVDLLESMPRKPALPLRHLVPFSIDARLVHLISRCLCYDFDERGCISDLMRVLESPTSLPSPPVSPSRGLYINTALAVPVTSDRKRTSITLDPQQQLPSPAYMSYWDSASDFSPALSPAELEG